MTTKLTLTIDDAVINAAKLYAQSRGKSLSHLIENYMKSLAAENYKEEQISPAVLKLKGALKMPDNFDYKKELSKAISNKQR